MTGFITIGASEWPLALGCFSLVIAHFGAGKKAPAGSEGKAAVWDGGYAMPKPDASGFVKYKEGIYHGEH